MDRSKRDINNQQNGQQQGQNNQYSQQQYSNYYQNVMQPNQNDMNRLPLQYPSNYGHQGVVNQNRIPQQNVGYINQQQQPQQPQQQQQFYNQQPPQTIYNQLPPQRQFQQPPQQQNQQYQRQLQQQQQQQNQQQERQKYEQKKNISVLNGNRLGEGFKRLLQTKYIIANEIGKGSFAKVFKGVNSETGECVAIKKIDKNKFDSQYLELIDSEISVLAQLNNEHIIKFQDLYNEGDYIYIVTELCELGDLEVFIKKHFEATKGCLPEELAKVFTYQILLAFLGIADNNIIHRDMKLSNVLISKNLRLKVADFGLAKSSHEKDKDQVGTPMTMAPEVLNNKGYDSKCDVWSVGCMLFEMIEGRPPFLPVRGGGIEELKRLISERNLIYKTNLSNNAKSLIDRMLTLNPVKRISWHEMFAHEWFAECVSQGEPFINKVSLDYSNFVDCEEKHLDPEFARDFGYMLRDFINYHIDTFFREIRKAQDVLLEFKQKGELFPPGQKGRNKTLLSSLIQDVNMLIALLFNHQFLFRNMQQNYQIPITKFCKDQIGQLYQKKYYDEAIDQELDAATLQEKLYADLITLSQNVMTDDFEFFKCNFAPIINLTNILCNPEKGFLNEITIDTKNTTSIVKDRLCLINISKAYFEEFYKPEIENKKDIIFIRNFVHTKLHLRDDERNEQTLLLSEIVFGYQQEVLQRKKEQLQYQQQMPNNNSAQSNIKNNLKMNYAQNY